MAAAARPEQSPLDQRIALLEEFARLETVGGICRVEHAMAVLDCCRRTVYGNRKLMAKRVKRGGRGIGFRPADVRDAQQLRRSGA